MAEIENTPELVQGIRRQGEAVLASLVGEIDLHNSPQVRAALLETLQREKPKRLILNLAGVPYMDSSAIAVLVESLQKIRKIGQDLSDEPPAPRQRAARNCPPRRHLRPDRERRRGDDEVEGRE
jgi:anti-anti-sigma factor